MAIIYLKRKENIHQEMWCIMAILQLCQQFVTCQYTVESSSQAFVQTDKELRFMVNSDTLGGIPMHSITGKKSAEDPNLYDEFDNPLVFEPPLLEFEEQPIGMPHLKTVTIQNKDEKSEIHLLSISGSTLHFHCSFFHEKYVPPGSNTTFEVVYLARQVGNVENTLYVHTNIGIFKYQVFGVGVPNPYRIRPILGAKVPLNTSFSPTIKLHNPYSSTLHVQEIYSSGGDLHLQLPINENDATKDYWDIPPYDTRLIAKASFLARVENNHTAFIRIKTKKEQNNNVLVLPFEVEVSAEKGIYSTQEMLDFGLVRSCDEPKTLQLKIINSGNYHLHINDIVTSPPNEAVEINFWPSHIKPDLWEPSTVAVISFNALKATNAKQWSGDIVIRSKTGGHQLTIPYHATVLHGSISYNNSKTLFYSGQSNRTITRQIPISNNFSFTLAIHDASFPQDYHEFFSFEKFKKPVYIKSGETVIPFLLKFKLNQSDIQFKTELCLHTNISNFYIPIQVYSGKLKPVFHQPELYAGQMDLGTLDMLKEYHVLLTLRNQNPIDVLINKYGSNLEKTTVRLLGVEKGNGTMLSYTNNSSKEEQSPLLFRSNHFAVFNISVVTPEMEGTFAGEIIFYTQYENLYIPIIIKTTEGGLRLKPDNVIFEHCFPGKVSYIDLRLVSTFQLYMALKKVTFLPNDTRFYYKAPTDEDIVLEPTSDKSIGRLYFDPRLGASGCEHDCYVGLHHNIPAGHQWILGSMLGPETPDVDQSLYMRIKQKWAKMVQEQTNVINVTIQMDTNHIRGFLFKAQAHLQFPSLRYNTTRINFPLTQIGNTSVKRLVIENPGDDPVLMQVLPLSIYPNPQIIIDLIRDNLGDDLNHIMEDSFSDVFCLYDLEKYNPSHPNISTRYIREDIEHTLGVTPHPETVALLIGERTKVRLRIGFKPIDHLPKTSLLVLRNNLTIIDVIVLHGHGGQGDIKLGNRNMDSNQPLVFKITEKSLKNCDKKRYGKSLNFTITRSFTVKNSGQLPFYVQGFSINDSPCEGYGFKVVDCKGFELQPNASRNVLIAFTPDFTMSRIQRTLTLHTSLGTDRNYTLQAVIPAQFLTKCSAVLPRPDWEPVLYYSILCVMGFFLFCVLVGAYFEADRIFTTDILLTNRSKQLADVNATSTLLDQNAVFNLKSIAGVSLPTSNGKINHNGICTGKTVMTTTAASISSNSLPSVPRSYYTSRRAKKEPTFYLLHLVKKGFAYIKIPKFNIKSYMINWFKSGNNNIHHKDSKSAAEKQHGGSNHGKGMDDGSQKNHKSANDPDLIADIIGRERTSHRNKSDHDCSTYYKNSSVHNKQDNNEEVYSTNGRKHRRNKVNQNHFKPETMIDATQPANELADDASSTTTDSSVDINEDKNTSQDLQQFVMKTGNKRNKKKNNTQKNEVSSEQNSEIFFVAGKSKNKKIKIESVESFEGQSLNNCEYDLPYMIKGEQRKVVGNEKQRPNSNNNKNIRNKTTSKRQKVLPNPNGFANDMSGWDPPKLVLPDSDLSDLSNQTQIFEQQHKGPSQRAEFGSGDSIFLPSSSYSSVVSNNNESKKSATIPLNPFMNSPSVDNGNSGNESVNGNMWYMSTYNATDSNNGFGFAPRNEINPFAPQSYVESAPSPAAPIGSALGLNELTNVFNADSIQQPSGPQLQQQRQLEEKRRQMQQKIRDPWSRPYTGPLNQSQTTSLWDEDYTPPKLGDSSPFLPFSDNQQLSRIWGANAAVGSPCSWSPIGTCWNGTPAESTPLTTTAGLGSPNSSVDGNDDNPLQPSILLNGQMTDHNTPSSSPPADRLFDPFISNTPFVDSLWNIPKSNKE